MPNALITGINGMDGSHLADLLLSKGYTIFGLERRRATPNRVNVKHIENMLGFITSFIVTVVLGLTLLTVIDLIK